LKASKFTIPHFPIEISAPRDYREKVTYLGSAEFEEVSDDYDPFPFAYLEFKSLVDSIDFLRSTPDSERD